MTPSVIAVEQSTGDDAVSCQTTSIHQLWAESMQSTIDELPNEIQDFQFSPYRDTAVLENTFEAWEVQRGATKICLGIRASGRILGQWTAVPRSEIRRYSLGKVYLLNQITQSGSEVHLVEANEPSAYVDAGAHLLQQSMVLVWWTYETGNYADVNVVTS
ncbi:uncharacterized protein MYCFIDRAFT_84414 [Pseudocercospora fijiensis CIRAD86]|uniref:Uncharacterized protein n=1 Tax=Pseudocercospora fijiensis (strain CIRAD86) TaxID=383855 RepID=M3AHJ4_PSEFD|nr:uncharacterized protein MYCFIDRAFT_84414 [Pseudocercospora fijiensis CIRAD86]EME76982.1 hypothetical protein MYCFIDRAFT_84414 [Pseudocercospora fijiensis CIRAD86]